MDGPVKIGVLTFHRCINYGSYWQARCLVEGLRAGGHDAVILDHASRRVDLAEWRCALRPTFPATRMDRPEYRRKVHRFHQAFAALPLSPLATPLPPSPLATPLPQSPLATPLPQSPLAKPLAPSPLAAPLGPSPLAAPLR